MEKTTQYDKILNHLEKYGKITSWEAIMDYGVTRISAIIFNLRRDGHNIISETIKTTNRFGEPTHFANYIYKGKVI